MEKQQNEQFTARKTMEEHMNVVAAANGYGIVTKSSNRQRDRGQVVPTNAIVKAWIETVTDLSKKQGFGRRKAVHSLTVLSNVLGRSRKVKPHIIVE